MRVSGFLRRQCAFLQGRWANPILMLLLILLVVFQIFGGANNTKETRRRSFEEFPHVKDLKTEKASERSKTHHCLPNSSSLPECVYNSPSLIGSIKSEMNLQNGASREEALEKRGPCLAHGGCFKPNHCKSQQKVAILIPYKDREAHLFTLLSYLHPQLQRQGIHYCVFVVEQFDDGRFNKGLVMNSGFLEILNSFGHFDCFIFHDVDMVPEDDRNIYLCQNLPTHLSPFIDKFDYRSHYGTDWGGVTMIRPEQYSKANGYSNMFWGWGREDSDMEFRLNAKGIKAIRPINEEYARFSMIPHEHPWRFQNEKYYLGSSAKITTKEKLMLTKRERSSWDGVNNAKYRLDHVVYDKLFTKLFVDIRRFEIDELQVVIDQDRFKDSILSK